MEQKKPMGNIKTTKKSGIGNFITKMGIQNRKVYITIKVMPKENGNGILMMEANY